MVPLLDANKRLAWAAAVTFLALNDHPVPDIDVDARSYQQNRTRPCLRAEAALRLGAERLT